MRNIGELKVENASAATVSSAFVNNVCDLCTVQVFGTATAMKVLIQGMTDIGSDSWENLAVFNMNDLTMADGDAGITAAGIYAVMAEGVQKIRINVVSVTGQVSVTAKFANTSDN